MFRCVHFLASLALVAGASHHTGRPSKYNVAKRQARSAVHDEQRLKRYEQHAEAHNQKPVEYKAKTHMVVPSGSALFSSSSESSTTEVEATYGDMTYYDYSVPVSVETTDGDMVELDVIMDTGSSNLAVATSECSNCDCLTETFDVETADPSYCLEVTYGSGQWSGELADSSVTVKLGDLEGSADYSLTTITSQNGFFDGDYYQGIFGLSYQALAGSYSSCESSSNNPNDRTRGRWAKDATKSQAGPQQQSERGAPIQDESKLSAETLLDTFASEGVIENRLFAISYCGDEATLSIGEVDESTYSGDLTYVSTEKTYGEFYGYFLTKVDSITLDSEEIDISTSNINEYGGALVDSGTTLLYLPSSIVSDVESRIESLCSTCDNAFFNDMRGIAASEASEFPDMIITLDADDGTGDTFDLVLTYENYLLEFDGAYYWGISSSSFPIIGNVAQNGRTVVFDLDNNKMAFATSQCSVSSLSLVDSISNSFTSMSFGALVSMIVAAVVLVVGAAFVIFKRQGRGSQNDESKYTYRLLDPEDDVPTYTDEQPNEITL